MSSYLSRLSLVPSFPSYTGPYKVGTIDIELPVSELESPSPSPDESISTIQYRIFYPCEPDSKGKSVNWIPAPQRDYVSAYTRFLGAGSMLAEVISFVPRLLHYITIPVRKNASLLDPPTSTSRWPVMIFSHGLGGSRNAYSYLAGSIASHGMIVIAPEHRDGSTPISYIRNVPSTNSPPTEKTFFRRNRKTVDYVRLSHTPSSEVEEGRNAQLKIRLWELGLVHDSLLKIDEGVPLTNLNTSSVSLVGLKNKMDVHTPGKITFAGHSFGAATIPRNPLNIPLKIQMDKIFRSRTFFYAKSAAHLSQSDFGILFPWFTKKFLAVEEPGRILRLNVRAVTQLLRNNGIEIGKTSHKDMEFEDPKAVDTNNDVLIFSRGREGEEKIRGWEFISTDMNELADIDDETEANGQVEKTKKVDPIDAVMGHEMAKEQQGTSEQLTDLELSTDKSRRRLPSLDSLSPDDSSDWKSEAATMHEVYKYAEVTIVATSSLSTHGGFLERTLSTIPAAKIRYSFASGLGHGSYMILAAQDDQETGF
ncbi:hypothetical protein G7Y89_g7214 [Cudoniella acicularis]|uniref:1-alkyl-2-acetylglycerophosphocholine esterase n=1 Tax=Cudoniella acicularis TaxID=354080 RepID=A0A8H4W2A8_9HELO|nr:hypothetical protein G7Y89_g7214 [Cudoniella acicularis]